MSWHIFDSHATFMWWHGITCNDHATSLYGRVPHMLTQHLTSQMMTGNAIQWHVIMSCRNVHAILRFTVIPWVPTVTSLLVFRLCANYLALDSAQCIIWWQVGVYRSVHRWGLIIRRGFDNAICHFHYVSIWGSALSKRHFKQSWPLIRLCVGVHRGV